MSKLTFDYCDHTRRLSRQEIANYIERSAPLLETVRNGQSRYSDSLGWLSLRQWVDDAALTRLEQLAQRVRDNAEVFVLVGVGGSNQAARAVISALGERGIRIVYAGNTLSSHQLKKLLNELEGRSYYINVVAKNFETLEPGLSFRLLRQQLERQHGSSACERIITTGTSGSYLEQLSREHGYEFLTFPTDIGGRYSVFSDVGLFPMAVAGLDIRRLLQGAREMREQLYSLPATDNPAMRYAAIRNLLYSKGMSVEMMSIFEPRYRYFLKWWVQLFGESEGKEGKGIYPAAAEYSEDLHSIGQFMQDGSPQLFETFLDVTDAGASLPIVKDAVNDRFEYLDGKDVSEVNRIAMEATYAAHSERLPCMRFVVQQVDEYSFGQLFYLFQFSCYLSGLMLGVDPFDQPGVEMYKRLMFSKLGKQ